MKKFDEEDFWTLVFLAYLLLSYPAHWWIMQKGVGIYNNDPKVVWHNGPTVKHGPSICARSFSFAVSPVMFPIAAIAAAAEGSIPATPPENPPKIKLGEM